MPPISQFLSQTPTEIDIACWVLAALHAVLALRTARQRVGSPSRKASRQAPVAVASSEGVA